MYVEEPAAIQVTRLSVCLSVCLHAHPPNCLFVCLSILCVLSGAGVGLQLTPTWPQVTLQLQPHTRPGVTRGEGGG